MGKIVLDKMLTLLELGINRTYLDIILTKLSKPVHFCTGLLNVRENPESLQNFCACVGT